MTDHVESFHAALTVLAGHGHVKKRLIRAFEDHLAEINEDDLPIALKQAFADLRNELYCVLPLNGEGPVCASVRKMSSQGASDCAVRIVNLYGELVRHRHELRDAIPLSGQEETRVPPFLVKSV